MVASLASAQALAFMIRHGFRIVSVGMNEEDLQRLPLPLMSDNNNKDPSVPVYTISVDIGVRTMRLMTNNPVKCTDLKGYGLAVVGRVPVLLPIKGKSKISRNKAYKDGQCLWFKFS